MRWGLLGLLAVGRALTDAWSGLNPLDFSHFADAGRLLLSAEWAAAFRSKIIQVGPLQLLIHGALERLGDLTGLDPRTSFSLVVQVGITFFTVLVTRRVVVAVRGTCPGWLELLVGLIVLVGQTSWTAYISGHPSDGVVALLWVLAAVAAREDRVVRSGILLALAAGFKQWGLLGAPILLLAPRAKRTGQGWGVQIAGTLVLYTPFFLFGEVSTLRMKWTVESLSLPRLFLPFGSVFPWWMRAIQGVFVVVVGAVVAKLVRDRSAGVWILPAAIVLARVLSEPFGSYYHWLAFDVVALVGVATMLPGRRGWIPLALAVGLYVELLAYYLPGPLGLAYRLAFATFLIVQGLRQTGVRSSTSPSLAIDSG